MTLSPSAGAAIDSIAHDLAGVDPRLAALALTFHVANHVLRSVAWRNVVAAASRRGQTLRGTRSWSLAAAGKNEDEQDSAST